MKRVQSAVVNIFLVIILFLALTNCKHMQFVKDAQESFSEGAAIENSITVNPDNSDLTTNIGVAISNYKLAYAYATKALEYPGKLKKDNLLGTAYSIQALSAWKLDNYSEAINIADGALSELDKTSRDYELMKAMRGLVKADQANDKFILGHSTMDNAKYSEIKQLTEGALDDLKAAANSSNSVQMRLYFVRAQATAIITWRFAEANKPAPRDFDEVWKAGCPVLKELLALTSKSDPMFIRLKRDLGATDAQLTAACP